MGGNLGRLLFSFYGRINWAKYWLANFVGIVFWAALLLLAWIATPKYPSRWRIIQVARIMIVILTLIGVIAMVIAILAVAVKRLHDRRAIGRRSR